MHTREGPGVVRGEGVDRIALSVVLCCGTRDVVSSERVTPHGHNNKDWYANPHNGTTAGTQTKCQGVSRQCLCCMMCATTCPHGPRRYML
jgi:hypothetical protein